MNRKQDKNRNYELLEKQNVKLHQENEKLRCLYEQLLTEAPKESVDPRRLLLLKNQVFLLERQCHNTNLQLNERRVSLEQSYRTLEQATCEMESWIQGGERVSVDRTDLERTLKTVRGVQKTLNKRGEDYSSVQEKFGIVNKFSEKMDSPHDIFSYNIKQMANLEHALSDLAQSVEEFRCSVLSKEQQIRSKRGEKTISHELVGSFKIARADEERKSGELLEKLENCCYDITLLSLLQPQIPHRNKPITKEITMTMITDHMQKYTRRKEILEAIPLLWQAASHPVWVLKKRVSTLETELRKCNRRLELHTRFVLDFIAGLEGMLAGFERDTLAPRVCAPLKTLIASYRVLQSDQSNENLTGFFKTLDETVPLLEGVVGIAEGALRMEHVTELQACFKNEMYVFTKERLAERMRCENGDIESDKENTERREKLGLLLKG